jgi:hypothetical protein
LQRKNRTESAGGQRRSGPGPNGIPAEVDRPTDAEQTQLEEQHKQAAEQEQLQDASRKAAQQEKLEEQPGLAPEQTPLGQNLEEVAPSAFRSGFFSRLPTAMKVGLSSAAILLVALILYWAIPQSRWNFRTPSLITSDQKMLMNRGAHHGD